MSGEPPKWDLAGRGLSGAALAHGPPSTAAVFEGN